MAQQVPVDTVDTGQQVTAPYREVSPEEWRAVPRTVPDWLLGLGSWLPLLGAGFWLFVARDTVLLPEPPGVWSLLVGAVTLIVIAFAAGRFAPWVAGAISGALLYFGSASGADALLLAVLTGYFLLLGLLAAVGSLRFCLVLRRWRREAVHNRQVDAAQLADSSAMKEVSPALLKIAVGATVLGGLKSLVSFLDDAQRQFVRINPDHLETTLLGLTGLFFWVALVLARAAARRFVGRVVLRVPVAPSVGGPVRFGILSGVILRAEARSAGCGCVPDAQATADEDDAYLNSFVKVNDNCPVHGIDAVNALGRQELLQRVGQPWLLGEHVHDGLVPAGTSVPLLGVSGWGCRPVRLLEDAGTPHGPGRHWQGIHAHRVREVFNRPARTFRWRGVSDESLEPVVWNGQEPQGTEVDRTSLSSVGIDGSLVRVAGARPYFLPAPRYAG